MILPSWVCLFAQTNPKDTTINPADSFLSQIDTTLDLDELFSEFDAFLDSINAPHSYIMATAGFTNGYYSYTSKDYLSVETKKQLTITPTLGFYHKTGLGVTAQSMVVNDNKSLLAYQYSVSPSFDYLKNKKLATGISFTKYITKNNLSFYTSPLKNELYGYFSMRKWWIRPTVAASYGWGTRSDYEEQETYITSLRLRPRGFTRIKTTESVNDFTVMASVRHDFYWLDVLKARDYIRVTPQFLFTSGTQKFGFNQTSSTYATVIRSGTNILYSSDNVYLDNATGFEAQSLTFFLRTEYSFGKFFIQPQFMVDYYFPATEKNVSTLFSLNAGLVF